MSTTGANSPDELDAGWPVSDAHSLDVALVSWPSAERSRSALRDARLPRLLLVPEGCDPPITEDEFEDWVRTPADPRDVQARVETLRNRVARDSKPHLDHEGRLHLANRWVALSPIERRLVQALLENYGAVSSKESLMKSAWRSGVSSRRLDVHLTRLRHRLETLGLTVRTVYGRGYVICRLGQKR